MRFFVALAFIFLGAFTGTALAADAVAGSDPTLSETARLIFDAVMHSSWWAAAAYGVVLAMIGARKLMPETWKTGIKGDVIGTASAFVLAFAGSVATVMAAPGATMTGAVVLAALKIGAFAIGGYTAIHKVAGWLAAWGKLPPWALAAVRLVAMMVGSNAVKKAEAAGVAAVVASPPTGITGGANVREVE